MPKVVDRTHPVYTSLAEQTERWIKAIEDLDRGEAFVRLGRTTTRLRTRILPKTRAIRQALYAITDQYAQRLMVPSPEVVPLVDGASCPTGDIIPFPRRARAG